MKLKTLREASYADESKGSLKWFLKNFFVEYQSQELTNGTQRGYRVQRDFEITARGRRVIGIDVRADSEYDLAVLHSEHGTTQHMYAPLKDLVVKQVKQIWPPS